MKTKLFLLILLFLIPFGCKEEKQIEIIPDYDRIYLPTNKLDEIPQLLEGDSQKLLDSVMNTYVKHYPISDTLKSKPTMEYKFMISETGKIEKIFLGKNNDKSIDELVLNTVKNWKYKPGVKDGKNVKSQMPMILWLESNNSINENNFATVVENMPGPIGGMYAIQEKIRYPEIAKLAGIQGRVIIQAFIDESGSVVHAKVLNGIGGGCDEMAIDAVKQTKFNPGKQNGKPVKVQVTIPILFKLQ
ncbi:MAG TPA: energy transducer TonB [Ignavibacteriaceae bacterium]